MAYRKVCPTCQRPFQQGSGLGTRLIDITKRAIARELGRNMAKATTAVQRYGNNQRGSGILGSILKSKPVRMVGKAVVQNVADRAIQAIAPVPERRRVTKKKKKKRVRATVKKQVGSGLAVAGLLKAAPALVKTIGAAATGTLVSHVLNKAINR